MTRTHLRENDRCWAWARATRELGKRQEAPEFQTSGEEEGKEEAAVPQELAQELTCCGGSEGGRHLRQGVWGGKARGRGKR
jgi:hypothetical protein